MIMDNENSGCLDSIFEYLFGPKKSKEWPYLKKRYLLTYTENSFCRVLLMVLGDKAVVQCKVRLADLLKIPSKQKDFISYWNKIQSKHVDFVLCKPESLEVIMVIELDDKSHRGEKAKKRDQFKDEAFTAAKIPLLRVKAKKKYDPKEIKRLIIEAVKGEDEEVEKEKAEGL